MWHKKYSGRNPQGNWFTRLSKGKKIALCVSGVVGCLVVSAGIYVAAKLGKVEHEEIPKKKIIVNELEEEVGVGYTNFALFGVDSREGEIDTGTRTDCLIVASLNNETKEVKLVSVYRDTFLDLSDGTLKKCNAAFSNGGAEQAINMLNMNLDLDIQEFVTVDFAAVAETVDLLGGIEIDIQEEEIQYINEFIEETGMAAGKEVHQVTKAGVQTLDGVQATTYARIRSTAGSDFTRTERQRRVIEKMAEKAVKTDIVTINKIIDKVFPKIRTSLSMTEILGYAKSFAKYRISETTGFPMEKATATIPGKGSIVIPADLLTNVQMLHGFLYGTVDYQSSSKVRSIDAAIKAELGKVHPEKEEVPSVQEEPNVSEWTEDSSTSDSVIMNSKPNQNQNGNAVTPAPDSGGSETVTPAPDKEPEKPQGGNSDNSGNNGNSGNGGTEPPVPDSGTGQPDSGNSDNGGNSGNGGTQPPVPDSGNGDNGAAGQPETPGVNSSTGS